ncbi:hypothetical protein EYF80_031949 [Liparis tanakae]|uniref:Uncharacterized protein n=1 Tax=Liparis tanakae TaxID=230148 RepID=A0A4Z2GW41_9TELE|nr:hypothetical protein EYF80_031949 [Liparis tanakae]
MPRDALVAHGQPHISGAGVPETVCFPECKHNDMPSDSANPKCPYKAHFVKSTGKPMTSCRQLDLISATTHSGRFWPLDAKQKV